MFNSYVKLPEGKKGSKFSQPPLIIGGSHPLRGQQKGLKMGDTVDLITNKQLMGPHFYLC